MRGYVPERGDIVSISFDPSAGKEIMQHRPALVMSLKILNQKTGMAFLVPITSTVRGFALEVALPDSCNTTGVAQTWQMKSLDWSARKIKFVEKSPKSLVDEVASKAKLCIGV